MKIFISRFYLARRIIRIKINFQMRSNPILYNETSSLFLSVLHRKPAEWCNKVLHGSHLIELLACSLPRQLSRDGRSSSRCEKVSLVRNRLSDLSLEFILTYVKTECKKSITQLNYCLKNEA